MRRMIIVGLVALAACGSDPAAEPNATATPEPAEVAVGNETVAVENESAPEPAPAPTPTPPGDDDSSESTVLATIPETLRGRWGITPADCTSTRGDAKGLIEISDSRLRFYESVATLREVEERDASRIVGAFSFVGEGQTWQRRMVLDAQDDGTTLIRRDYGDDAMPGPLRYRKCES